MYYVIKLYYFNFSFIFMQKHQKILIFANILRVNLSYLSNYY